MNRIKIYILSLLSLLLLFNCTKEESTIPEKDRLYIHVATTAFAADGVPSTKAVNTGFLTTFEIGDAIGVTGIGADGNILAVCNNVKFNYKGSETINGVIWANFIDEVHGYSFVERVDGAKYFAYYPYSEKAWNVKNLNDIISNFEVQPNQSTKENFDKSDLMATDEPIAPVNSELQFIMHHKMTTISIFYNNEFKPDGVTPLYKINLYDATTPSGLRITNTYRATVSEGTSHETGKTELRHRYLLNPAKTNSVKLVGCLEEESYRYFSKEINNLQPGVLYSVSFEGEPLVPYTDGVDLELDDVKFEDKDGKIVTLGHTVIWSKYNLGESLGETYPFEPLPGEKGGKTGSRDPYARGDYYCWGATFTQYDNGITGYHGYGYNNYFDKEYKIAPLGGTIKETEYDVAHAKWWRGKWRLPTENEFRAMYAGCEFKKVGNYKETNTRYIGDYGGKSKGTYTFDIIKVTSKKNPEKFIYLSTGGYFDGTLEPEKDKNGNFTSSGDGKLNNGCVNPTTAYYLSSTSSPKTLKDISYAFFTADKQQILTNGSRYTGMLVRPVYSPNEK